jgi:hypothetical protein
MIYRLSTFPVNKIDLIKDTYSWFLSCDDLALLVFFKTIEQTFSPWPRTAPFLFILYVFSGLIPNLITVSLYRLNQ